MSDENLAVVGDSGRDGGGAGEEAEVGGSVEPPNGDIRRASSEPHMEVVERYLDDLTLSGSTINDLELQLERTRATYRKALAESRRTLEEMRKQLGACIPRSQPFIDMWKKARQVQEESNRAAASYDKASSQYTAAKEMIRVAELQLNSVELQEDCPTITALNHAWQEMLNHATIKVVETEKEKRRSEVEHRRVLDNCTQVMEEYKAVEKKLRPQIIKSRPYFEERWKCGQKLAEIKSRVDSLAAQLQDTKHRYSSTLRHLEVLNHTIHQQRRTASVIPSNRSPIMSDHRSPSLPQLYAGVGEGRGGGGGVARVCSDSESVQSWQLCDDLQYTGSTGSLPSIGTSSVSGESEHGHHSTSPQAEQAPLEAEQAPLEEEQAPLEAVDTPTITVTNEDTLVEVARGVVARSLAAAVARLDWLSTVHTH